MQGNITAEQFYEDRSLPEYKVAFEAWLKLNPFGNKSSAPPIQSYMPQYQSAKLNEGNQLTATAASKIPRVRMSDQSQTSM
ncbi:MAG TPA: hypothetical protein VEF35_05200 [Candidatus Bathyarchaeia archaeon]|nr:hypothetical protein [Candidatus Bathyarchaeia archaeon]